MCLWGGPDLLCPCYRVTVTPDGTLIIRNISRSDEGKYTCFAENFMGKANSTGILSVRGKGCGLAEAGGLGHQGALSILTILPSQSHIPPSLILRLLQNGISLGIILWPPSRI